MQSYSRHEEKMLQNEFRESQSTVNQLTVQIQKLEVYISSLDEAREKDFETVNSIWSFHVPGQPLKISQFFRTAALVPLPAA